MNDNAPEAEYQKLVDDTLSHWREAIYRGVLVEQVLPAVRIYAYASLIEIADPPNIDGCFPLMPNHWTLSEHYANRIFTSLSVACGSIMGALQAIRARIDGHSAIAISRRAHESLWQTFWVSNPDVSADERARRLLNITGVDIKAALRVFSSTTNAEIHGKLVDHLTNIKNVIGNIGYQTRSGRDEYETYFEGRANEGLDFAISNTSEDVAVSALEWSIMSNMTHPNLVFDLITQSQTGYQGLMDRIQVDAVQNAVSCACNISTLLLEKAQLPANKVDALNGVFRQPVFALEQLLDMRREVGR